MKINPILDKQVEAEIAAEIAAALEAESPELEGINAQLDRIFRDPALKFFQNSEREKLKLRENGAHLEIYCLNRKKWLRAKPEEVVRQLFLVYVRDSLFYPSSIRWSASASNGRCKWVRTRKKSAPTS